MYKIKNSQILAIRILGQWRVLIKSGNICSMQDIDDYLPPYVNIENVCKLLKIRECILFGLICKRHLNIADFNGKSVIAKSCLVHFIKTQNNMDLEMN